MDIELYFTVMAGMVLAFFLMVSEVVALRKAGAKFHLRVKRLQESGRRARAYAEMSLVALFFLVQPFIVAYLVVGVLEGFHHHFTDRLIREFRQSLREIVA